MSTYDAPVLRYVEQLSEPSECCLACTAPHVDLEGGGGNTRQRARETAALYTIIASVLGTNEYRHFSQAPRHSYDQTSLWRSPYMFGM
eukprot:3921926-Pyramimonas_sp.AAC.1